MPRSCFEYFPLLEGQIRLLTLYDTAGKISCALTRKDFKTCPDYFALSYAWGAPPPECEILVNGRAFMIRENLYDCLSSLSRRPHSSAEDAEDSERRNAKRVKSENAHFWIDQLCIDQTNIAERNQQVSIMDQIYGRAKETIVWVGTNQPDEDSIPDQLLEFDDPLLVDMYHIFAKPYWTRLWIVQEVLLSKAITVRSGDQSYSWDLCEDLARELARALGFGEDKRKVDRHQDTIAWRRQGVFNGLPDAAACVLNDKWSSTSLDLNGGRRLSDLVQRFAQQGCENVVDKVYALQGLVEPRGKIEINYSMSPEELLYRTVDKLAQSEGDDLFEDEQLDVCLTLRRELRIPVTKESSQRIAQIVFSHVKKRLSTVGQDLTPEEEEVGLSHYLRYLDNPGPTHIPSQFRVNDFARGTYKEFMLDHYVSQAMGRANLKRFMESAPKTMPKKVSKKAE